MKKKLFIFFAIIFISISVFAQKQSAFNQFKKLSRPEKIWVYSHPFVAKKTWHLTKVVMQLTDSVNKTDLFDNDPSGGQVDAFRHAFWMAYLSQEIYWKKVYKLGIAHEKGNYLEYKHNKIEDGIVPDKISSDMDFWNNNIGIRIGRANKRTNINELRNIIVSTLNNGELRIIKKNKSGEFLNCNNIVIQLDSLKGLWLNNKCLVESNYKRIE